MKMEYINTWLLWAYKLILSHDSLNWHRPHVSFGEQNGTTFEWWHQDRKLSVNIDDDGAALIRVWGPDINHQMEEANAEDENEFIQSWIWLYHHEEYMRTKFGIAYGECDKGYCPSCIDDWPKTPELWKVSDVGELLCQEHLNPVNRIV